MSYTIANYINTTVASTFSNVATTLQLASSTGLPSPTVTAPMPVILIDAATGTFHEIVYATSISGANLTVVRAREGTAAQNWPIGSIVICGPTAGTVATVGSMPFYGADAGAVNAYAVSLPPVTAYYPGLFFGVLITNTNTTTTPTVNVTALGAKTIVLSNGSPVNPGDLPAGMVAWFTYDGTNAQLMNPASAMRNKIINVWENENNSPITDSTAFLNGNTPPPVGTGTLLCSLTITPTLSTSRLKLRIDIPFISASTGDSIAQVFIYNTTAPAFVAGTWTNITNPPSGAPAIEGPLTLQTIINSFSGTKTFAVHIASSTASASISIPSIYGAVQNSTFTIEEFMPS